ncbi:hypothetical protein B0H13DRAFT_1865974 [Mycena leptocephala]|nr:hypothetical protein B0H13DRAFT_1865974 [Mycena leptocephala]
MGKPRGEIQTEMRGQRMRRSGFAVQTSCTRRVARGICGSRVRDGRQAECHFQDSDRDRLPPARCGSWTQSCTYVGPSGLRIAHKGRAWIRLGLGLQAANKQTYPLAFAEYFGNVESDVAHEQEVTNGGERACTMVPASSRKEAWDATRSGSAGVGVCLAAAGKMAGHVLRKKILFPDNTTRKKNHRCFWSRLEPESNRLPAYLQEFANMRKKAVPESRRTTRPGLEPVTCLQILPPTIESRHGPSSARLLSATEYHPRVSTGASKYKGADVHPKKHIHEGVDKTRHGIEPAFCFKLQAYSVSLAEGRAGVHHRYESVLLSLTIQLMAERFHAKKTNQMRCQMRHIFLKWGIASTVSYQNMHAIRPEVEGTLLARQHLVTR